ncbi:MAG: PAS domain-containing sensor histidine kinase, partial [Chitinophagaceae bacterium]
GISVFFKDITERRKAEIKARESEEKYQVLIERITDAFVAFDEHFCYTYVNKQAGELIHMDPEKLIGRNVWEVFPDAVNSATYVSFLQAMRNQTYVCSTDYYEPLDLWQENHIYPSNNGISVFIRDITERKRSEQQLRNSESRLREAQAVAHISNWEIDLVKRVHRWSEELYRMCGLNEATSIASTELFLRLVHPEDREVVEQKMREAFADNTSSSMYFRFTGGNQQLRYGYAEWKFQFDEHMKPVRLYGIMQDITERKQAELDLKEMEERLLEQKIQEQKKIARAIITGQEKERNYIGRELHDSVCQILVGAKLHMGTTAIKASAMGHLIKYPIELIDTAVEEIRALSHQLVTPVKNIDLEELVRELLYNLGRSTELDIHFEYALTEHLKDDDLKLNIYRLVQELISNMLKHAAATHVDIILKQLFNMISIQVADNGKGFDMQNKTGGIGISNMINRVQSFNGNIQITSSPGTGCTVNILIPNSSM